MDQFTFQEINFLSKTKTGFNYNYNLNPVSSSFFFPKNFLFSLFLLLNFTINGINLKK